MMFNNDKDIGEYIELSGLYNKPYYTIASVLMCKELYKIFNTNEKYKKNLCFIFVEEFVEKYGYQIAGNGLSIDGRLIFRCFANNHFTPKYINPFVPISASFLYNMSKEVQDIIHNEIQKLLTLLNMKTCTYIFDIRIDKNLKVYLMEVAPRNGGNYIPDIVKLSTGVYLVEYAVRGAMGEDIQNPGMIAQNGYWTYFAVHSLKDGKLNKIDIKEEVIINIVENHIMKKRGDIIETFKGVNSTL